MGIVHLTTRDFDRIANTGIVLLDWWAPWCAPCHAFAPVFESAAARHPDVVFAKINIDQEPALQDAFNIQAVPTLMIVREGVVLAAEAGFVSGPALDELLRKVRAVDMVAVQKSFDDAAAFARRQQEAV